MTQRVHVSASIGIASWQPDWSFEELLRQADAAMYAAKARHHTLEAQASPSPTI
jgi:PleD family two-component response regulator